MWSLRRKRNFPSVATRPGLTGSLQSCASHIQGENTEDQNSSRVETGQCCATQLGDFKKYVNNKRRCEENIGPILVGNGHLTSRNDGKVEAFSAFLASVFSINCLGLPGPEAEDCRCGNSLWLSICGH